MCQPYFNNNKEKNLLPIRYIKKVLFQSLVAWGSREEKEELRSVSSNAEGARGLGPSALAPGGGDGSSASR